MWQTLQDQFLDENGQSCEGPRIAIAVSDHVTCYTGANGELRCGGSIYTHSYTFSSPVGLTGIDQIMLSKTSNAADGNAMCVHKDDATVWCMGSGSWGNSWGQFGVGDNVGHSDFVQWGGRSDLKRLGTGTWDQMCALTTGNEVLCSGYNLGLNPVNRGTGSSFYVTSFGTVNIDPPTVVRASAGRTECTVSGNNLVCGGQAFSSSSPIVDGGKRDTSTLCNDEVATNICLLNAQGTVECLPDVSQVDASCAPFYGEYFGAGQTLALATNPYTNRICAVKKDGSIWCADGDPNSAVQVQAPGSVPTACDQTPPTVSNTISVDFTATVTAVYDDDFYSLNGQVQVGDTITGTYIYDPTTPDLTSSPTDGLYLHTTAPYGIDLNIKGIRFRTDPANVSFYMQILNGNDNDNFILGSYNNLFDISVPDATTTYISLNFNDPNGEALLNDALSTTAPVTENWQNKTLHIRSSNYPQEFSISANITSAVISGGGSGMSDADGDGIEDAIDTDPDNASGNFADTRTPLTAGSIDDKAGLDVSVKDASDTSLGVTATVGPGSSPAQASLSVCGFPVLLNPDSTATITCGSISLIVEEGSAQVLLDNGNAVVDLIAGANAKITQSPEGPFTIENLGDNLAVSVTRNGSTVTVEPDSAYLVGQNMTGYFEPVDMDGVYNVVKAGSAIPLKWRLTHVPEDTPVTDLASVKLQVQNVVCDQGAILDSLEEVASGGSGLQYLGDGNYQTNWKTPKGFAGSCRKLVLDFGGGYTAPPALFKFK